MNQLMMNKLRALETEEEQLKAQIAKMQGGASHNSTQASDKVQPVPA